MRKNWLFAEGFLQSAVILCHGFIEAGLVD